jgi:hypothetical protein
MLVSAEGAAPAERVWERYTSPALWPGWAPQISRVDADDDPIVGGTRGTVHGPLFTFAPFRIRYVDDRARTWSWWVGFGPAGVGMDHGVDETDAGSRAWVRIHAHRWLAAPYAPIARLALRRLVKPEK